MMAMDSFQELSMENPHREFYKLSTVQLVFGATKRPDFLYCPSVEIVACIFFNIFTTIFGYR